MSTTTEPHDRPAGLRPAPDTLRVTAPSVLDAGTAEQLSAPVSAASPGAAVVVDLTAVTELSLEAAAALMTLTRRCHSEGRAMQVIASAAARRKLALLGLDVVLPLRPPT
ncbi:STAS domain-containing protein [Amycolatopsis sp. cmx-4-83]|uniref:STAS domain-containing protein n=1 Tax=Amycolatopsis sp. cmx-4-83 TaxID=2790940 RepID=UPI00397E4FE1